MCMKAHKYILKYIAVKERGYVNMRREAWIASRIPAVTQAELIASDDIRLVGLPEIICCYFYIPFGNIILFVLSLLHL